MLLTDVLKKRIILVELKCEKDDFQQPEIKSQVNKECENKFKNIQLNNSIPARVLFTGRKLACISEQHVHN